MKFIKLSFAGTVLLLYFTDVIHNAEAYVLLTAALVAIASVVWSFCPNTGASNCETSSWRKLF